MYRQFILAVGLALILAAPCSAITTLSVGNHVFSSSGEATFPLFGTSDSGETLAGIDLYLAMDLDGPIITNVNLIEGTVFALNNLGQFDYNDPQYETPTYEPAYSTVTVSGSVPTGIVAWVTVDFTGVSPGTYNLSLYNPAIGPSAVYNQIGVPGLIVDGTVTLVPEPSSVVLGLFAAATIGAFSVRRRVRR